MKKLKYLSMLFLSLGMLFVSCKKENIKRDVVESDFNEYCKSFPINQGFTHIERDFHLDNI